MVPLGQPITRFAGAPLAQPLTFTLGIDAAGVTGGEPTDEEFALAQFEEMRDADKLSLPSFTRLHGGVQAGGDRVDLGHSARSRSVVTNLDYDTTIIDSTTSRGARYVLGAEAFAAMNQRTEASAAGRYAPPVGAAPRVALAEERYQIATTGDLSPEGTIAHDGSKLGAMRALAAWVDAHPGARGQLQVVLSAEAPG
ncbi:MAG TPA: hypothetical protein VF469_34325 [Kofleriaceae bacterium]